MPFPKTPDVLKDVDRNEVQARLCILMARHGTVSPKDLAALYLQTHNKVYSPDTIRAYIKDIREKDKNRMMEIKEKIYDRYSLQELEQVNMHIEMFNKLATENIEDEDKCSKFYKLYESAKARRDHILENKIMFKLEIMAYNEQKQDDEPAKKITKETTATRFGPQNKVQVRYKEQSYDTAALPAKE